MTLKQTAMYLPQGGLYDRLHEIVSSKLDQFAVQVAFAAFGKGDQVTRFEKLELSPELAQEFREVVLETFGDLERDLCSHMLQIHPYGGNTQLQPHEIEHVKTTEHESVKNLLAQLTPVSDMEPFEEDLTFESMLRFYVIILQNGDEPPIYCFRTFTAKNRLRRTWFAAIRRGPGYYNSVPEAGFLFDRDIDSICSVDDLYILNKDKFKRTFNFYEYIRRDADAALRKLKTRIPIANQEDFEQVCRDDIRVTAIVAGLLNAPHLDVMSTTRMKREIERLHLHVDVVPENGQEFLVYSAKYKWEFLNLICDNYGRSTVTDIDYEMNSKRPLSTKVQS